MGLIRSVAECPRERGARWGEGLNSFEESGATGSHACPAIPTLPQPSESSIQSTLTAWRLQKSHSQFNFSMNFNSYYKIY